jgi:hypothetical protein
MRQLEMIKDNELEKPHWQKALDKDGTTKGQRNITIIRCRHGREE